MLPCVNCKQGVDPAKAKLFAEVYVCPDCYKVAELLHTRGRKELEQYMTLLDEMIRTSLIAGSLQLKMKDEKPDVMGSITDMREAMKSKCKKESTLPHVCTLAALGQQGSKPPTPVGIR